MVIVKSTRLAAVAVVFAISACSGVGGAASDAAAGGCAPSPVERDGGLPVVRAGDDIQGRLFYYDESYEDVDVAVMPPHGEAGPDRTTKILWQAAPGGGPLTVRGVNAMGSGTFEQSFPEATSPQGDYPSIIELPGDGCWQLTLDVGDAQGLVTFRTDA